MIALNDNEGPTRPLPGLVDVNGMQLKNELSINAKGGTELLQDRLYETVDKELLDRFQIWFSRFRREDVDNSKLQIFYAHDLAGDPEAEKALGQGGWMNFHKIVFVSNWQAQQYISKFDIPPSRTKVLLNSIVPIDVGDKSKDGIIKLGYWSTPHRGLEILVPVFERLANEHDNIHLEVFSSFKLYGWPERDEPYTQLFEQIEAHPNMTYRGAASNGEVRDFASKAHIWAMPSIWPETSCLSLMEAMSAGMMCIHPNLGALYETGACWTEMYQYQEDFNQHAAYMYSILKAAVQLDFESPVIKNKLMNQKMFADATYNWNTRSLEWKMLLQELLQPS